MDAISPEILNRINPICRKWRINRLSLFGSVARGDDLPGSDVDLLVAFEPGATPSLLRFVAAQREFSQAIGRPVDLVLRDALQDSDTDNRARHIISSARVLYAA